MKKLLFMVIFLPMSLFSAPVEFWTCKFADGYDMNDLNKWVGKWNKNLDDNLEEQSYSAYVMTPSFSSNLLDADFIWAGSWANFAAMGAGFEEYFGEDAKGMKIHAEFEKITNCSSHVLVNSTQVRQGSE